MNSGLALHVIIAIGAQAWICIFGGKRVAFASAEAINTIVKMTTLLDLCSLRSLDRNDRSQHVSEKIKHFRYHIHLIRSDHDATIVQKSLLIVCYKGCLCYNRWTWSFGTHSKIDIFKFILNWFVFRCKHQNCPRTGSIRLGSAEHWPKTGIYNNIIYILW